MSESDHNRYLKAAHAMQSGVAAWMHIDPKQVEPKHLRVGINSAMSDHGALVGLLVAKGVITSDEYTRAVADSMEREAASYEERLSAHFGKPVTLA